MGIVLVLGDITRERVDAVVNAANSSLMGGGGVDGAIHRAGGPAILEECRRIVTRDGPLAPGGAVVTSGGRLAARWVVHVVGPIWRGGSAGEEKVLARAYAASLARAAEVGAKTVAFPSISTGAFGFPVARAAPIALRTVRAGLPSLGEDAEARFVLFDEATFHAYEESL